MPPQMTAEQMTERFAANLRAARERTDMTQEQLADAAGLHRTAISFLERAEREPRMWTVVMLARALRIPPSELLDGIR
jgi:DNA-binding XRE family transcriptional regulator